MSSFLENEALSAVQSLDIDAIAHLYRGRRYWTTDGWQTYYEPCPVVKRSEKYLTVQSEEIDIAGFYKGGTFKLKKSDLKANGKTYHSRHGEYFYVIALSDRAPLPTSAVLSTNPQPESGSMVLGTPHR